MKIKDKLPSTQINTNGFPTNETQSRECFISKINPIKELRADEMWGRSLHYFFLCISVDCTIQLIPIYLFNFSPLVSSLLYTFFFVLQQNKGKAV